MTPIRRQLLDMIEDTDYAFTRTESELAPLRLQAAQELFEERKTQIPLVAKRAEDAGISAISSFDDLVPLLFAHTVYKSYPPSRKIELRDLLASAGAQRVINLGEASESWSEASAMTAFCPCNVWNCGQLPLLPVSASLLEHAG